MKKRLLSLIFLGSLATADPIDMAVGTNLQYARFHQNCLSAQKGFLAGPTFSFEVTYPWRPYLGIFFDGLWDVANLCSKDGLFVNSTQYNTMLKFGFNFDSDSAAIIVTPYIGAGFLHLSHELKEDMITYRYNNVYIPIGIKILHEPFESFSWELLAHYRFDAYTRLKVSTPCVCDTDDCKIKLERSHGAFISLPLTWTYGEDRRVGFITRLIPTFDWQKFNGVNDCCDEGLTLPIPTLKHWKLGIQGTIGINF